MNIKPFKEPIFVTRPILPDLKEVQEKLKELWKAKWLTNNGPQHEILEKELTDYLQVPYLSLFNNGTNALMVALQSLELTGEVITTPFTFAATTHVIKWNRLDPVFCDIDPITLNIDPNKIEALITERTSAILAVHVFGTPCDVIKIQQIADKYKLKVIYDAAHAFGVEIKGQPIGNFGDITMFSFHATKLYHSIEGGALTSKTLEQKNKIDLLKNFGIKNEEEVILPGINGKMNEVQAAIGQLVLKCVPEERKIRREIRSLYKKCLSTIKGISIIEEIPDTVSSYQYFVIRIDEKIFGTSRNEVYEKFKKYNVFARKYFYPLCSQFDCYIHLDASRPENLPVANRIVNEVLALPFYGALSLEEVRNICKILESFKSST